MAVSVFLSFSGEASAAVAQALHQWLPCVIQAAEPFLSSQSIDSGSRWSPEIGAKLEDSGIGVLCLTPSNLEAPWILFEAGALGKILDESRVIPYLIGVDRVSIRQPLSQFQSELADKEGTLKILKVINGASASPIPADRLEGTFEKWWPDLAQKIEEAANKPPPPKASTKSDSPTVTGAINELIQNVQGLQSHLANPERLLPPEYLRHVMSREANSSQTQAAEARIQHDLGRLRELVSGLRKKIPQRDDNEEIIRDLRAIQMRISMMRDRVNRGYPRAVRAVPRAIHDEPAILEAPDESEGD